MKTEPLERIAILVDGANTYATTKALLIDADFVRMATELSRGKYLVRPYYFTTVVETLDQYKPLKPLLDFLSYNGFSVVTKDLKELEGGQRERGSVVVDLTVTAFDIAQHVDNVILCTGDGQFSPLVDGLQRQGVRVTLVSTLTRCDDELRRKSDSFIEILKIKDAISRVDARPVREVA